MTLVRAFQLLELVSGSLSVSGLLLCSHALVDAYRDWRAAKGQPHERAGVALAVMAVALAMALAILHGLLLWLVLLSAGHPVQPEQLTPGNFRLFAAFISGQATAIGLQALVLWLRAWVVKDPDR